MKKNHKYRVGKVPVRYVPQGIDDDLRRIDRAVARLDVTRHSDWSPLRRGEIKTLLARLQVAPYWRIQLDRFLELLPEDWGSLLDEWQAFLQYGAVPRGRPPGRTRLRLVVDNKPKPPASKTTPRWRPPARRDDDDGPRAA